MRISKLLLSLVTGLATVSSLQAETIYKYLVVQEPVTDICQKLFNETDPTKSEELISQGLYGEGFTALEEVDGWYRVVSHEQTLNKDGEMVNVEGWAIKDDFAEVMTFPNNNLVINNPQAFLYQSQEDIDQSGLFTILSMGTKLSGKNLDSGWWTITTPNGHEAYIKDVDVGLISSLRELTESELRHKIVELALNLENSKYIHGGRSASSLTARHCGFDNASFIELLHRSFGRNIPRSCDGQYQIAKDIVDEPQRGDLVFLVNPDNQEVIHAMMVVHDDLLIECTGITKTVRTVSATERLGAPLHRIQSGEKTENSGDYEVYFKSLVSQ